MLVHGFTATAEEMLPLGHALAAAGHPVIGVQLPGHGTEPRALAEVGASEWLTTVEDAIAALRRDGRRVTVIGMSMGALLALLAAARRRDVDAVVACGTALAVTSRWVPWLPLIERVPFVARRWPLIPRGGVRGISDPALRAASPSYDAVPWRAVREFLALQAATRTALPAVAQPFLALHGRHDRTVPPSVLDELRASIGSPWVETQVFERSWHVITMDVEQDAVARRVAEFLARVEAALPG